MPDRTALRRLYRIPQADALASLIPQARQPPPVTARIEARARTLVRAARAAHRPGADVTDFLREYGLGSAEGIALLCLAEALLRIPDAATADALIEDRLAAADWELHLGRADSLMVNASAWAFMLTGRMLGPDTETGVAPAIRRVVRRMGEPVIRTALRRGMRVLARQFVMGRTIEEALGRAATPEGRRWRHSFDMLGEAAKTQADARRYFAAYQHAIGAIGAHAAGAGPIDGPGISVKLSALHPRYEPLQAARCVPDLIQALTPLARQARQHAIGLTIDAEEAERLELSLDVLESLLRDPALAGWDGLGLAVQAYQKRAPAVIDWTAALARETGHIVPVRLVKGAYWDTEIKLAQIAGHADYPVFTRKAATDISWLACASRMLAAPDAIRPAFATHNAHSLATILETAAPGAFEMQRLHGMGEALYQDVVSPACPVRIYAPVGTHEDLLAYLVRRLLENGANTSFVHRLVDPAVPEEAVIADPLAHPRPADHAHPPAPRSLPRPRELRRLRLVGSRRHRRARRLSPRHTPRNPPPPPAARSAARPIGASCWTACPTPRPLRSMPVSPASPAPGAHGTKPARRIAPPSWIARADLIEAARDELLSLLAREGGKTLVDGMAEVREAADFCRWYAARAREQFPPRELPGPTGERNTWALGGRGVFAAIAPWNFPLAIFTGQVAAALAAGNAVIAKPAEQTPLIGTRAIDLLHQAGVPRDILAIATGDGRVGQALVSDPRIAGVAFTGGTETAQAIARAIAARPGPIIPFIAETGGINAMIVDSSALPEQVVADILTSAFGSAGQRCSATRLLCIQEELAPRLLEMLQGAAETLVIGDPLVARHRHRTRHRRRGAGRLGTRRRTIRHADLHRAPAAITAHTAPSSPPARSPSPIPAPCSGKSSAPSCTSRVSAPTASMTCSMRSTPPATA